MNTKIQNVNDIKVLARDQKTVIVSSSLSGLSENNLGGLVKISGMITSRKSSYMYIDDEGDEIKIIFKAGTKIDKKKYKIGDEVEVTGVFQNGRDEWQLLPRSDKDIFLLNKPKLEKLVSSTNKLVSTTSDYSKSKAKQYLVITASGIFLIILGIVVRILKLV